MLPPLGKLTKNHRIVHLQWVNFMVRKLCLNKALKTTTHVSHLYFSSELTLMGENSTLFSTVDLSIFAVAHPAKL